MKNSHDEDYTLLFSNKEIFRQLITSFVHEAWVKDLDFSRCELVKGSFVSRKYKKTFSDLLYKVKFRGRELYIVILLEFKSQPAYFVAVQVAGYILDFYRHLIDSEKRLKKLPAVFPIVLYNGKKRWTSPLRLSDLVEGATSLSEYGIELKYFPIIENTFSPRQLKRIGNIVSTLFLAETHYDAEVLADELASVFSNAEDKQAASLFLNWLRQMFLHERIDEEDFQALQKIYQNQEEVSMLIEAIRKEKAQLRAQGKRAGKREGKRKGEKLKAWEIAAAMLQNGEPAEKIQRYTGLSYDALLKAKTRSA